MGFLSGLFKGRSSTTTQEAMLTDEQKKAMAALSGLGQTGSMDGLTLGDAYGGSLGNFDMTGTESLAGNRLFNLLNAGSPEGINTARNTLTTLADTRFNPDDPSSGFAAYARQVARATGDANDALNRESAITGDRFSTSIMKNKADLGVQQSDILATKLGELYNASQNRALQAAQGLTGLESTNENINQSRIGAGFQYGGLQRDLMNAEANAKYSEFMRQRDEKLKRIDILNNVFNKDVRFGEMTKTTKSPSIFGSILGQVNPLVGAYNTAKYGATNAPNQMNLGDSLKSALSIFGDGAGEGGSTQTGIGKGLTFLRKLALGF